MAGLQARYRRHHSPLMAAWTAEPAIGSHHSCRCTNAPMWWVCGRLCVGRPAIMTTTCLWWLRGQLSPPLKATTRFTPDAVCIPPNAMHRSSAEPSRRLHNQSQHAPLGSASDAMRIFHRIRYKWQRFATVPMVYAHADAHAETHSSWLLWGKSRSASFWRSHQNIGHRAARPARAVRMFHPRRWSACAGSGAKHTGTPCVQGVPPASPPGPWTRVGRA